MFKKITDKKIQKKQNAFISIFAIFFSAIITSILTSMYILIVKQIQIMDIDSASFQSLYIADSAFECVLYKEQNNTSTASFFLPNNNSGFGDCGNSGDTTWLVAPVDISGRATSTINITYTTQQGDYCGVVVVGKQVDNSEISNYMSISGQSRNCTTTGGTVIERLIEFFY